MSPTPEPGRCLTRALIETEQHVATAGWDQPVRLFSLVKTSDLLAREPSLRGSLDPQTVQSADADANYLIAIEQENLPHTPHLESLLGGLAWGPEVDGVAVVVERMVVPPAAERDLPADPQAALDHLAAHPERADVRLVVAVLRDGQQQCGVRQRNAPEPGKISVGPDLVPGLVAALAATL